LNEIAAGDWRSFEETGLDQALRDLGFDGFTTREPDKGNAKNYAVFNVDNIVPGVAKKAEGGVITLADVARNMNRGPRGLDGLVSVARNMDRSMVS